MNISINIENVHDLIMLDTIIDLWKAKWAEDVKPKEDDDDDAEDEPCGCDDESDEDDKEEAIRDAAKVLFCAIRDAGYPRVGCIDLGDAVRRKHRS